MPKVKTNQNKVIHPKSRKAQRITAKAMHKEKMKKLKGITAFKQTMVQEKLNWFKANLDNSKSQYSKVDLSELVEKYLARFQDELEQINIIHGLAERKGKQHVSRETAIDFTVGKEKTDFETCGLEVPDLCDARNLRLFRAWDGSVKYIPNIKMKRIKKVVAAIQRDEPELKGAEDAGQEADEVMEGEEVESDEGAKT